MTEAPGTRELDITLERNSPVPLYYQLAQSIKHAITTGALAPGERLENELSLTSRLGLSRPTIRQAIGSLVDKGLVVRKRGAGTQVVFNRVKRSLELSSLFDDLSRVVQQPTTKVLVNEVITPSPEVAHLLGIAEEGQVLHLERVRFARGEPIARMRNYLPAGLIEPTSEQLEERGLLRQALDECRIARAIDPGSPAATERCGRLQTRIPAEAAARLPKAR